MKKPIFENEQEAREFLECCIQAPQTNHIKVVRSAIDLTIREAKSQGYIKKSTVDEAEEMFNHYHEETDEKTFKLIEKQYEAIQELKAEIERLNENNN